MKALLYSVLYLAGVSCDIAGDLLDIFLGNTLSLFGETVVSPADVNMYLFTRENPSLPVVITSDNAPLLNDGKPVKIIIHGWQNNGSSDWMNEMRTAYLMKGDYNVVQVDWGTIATQLYSTAADGTRGVGSIVAGVIISSEAPFENIHIIGHSLGAQVAGFIGRTMKGSSGQLIDRITGLDPARPLFEDIPTETSLSKTDAVMVDIIHTDGGKLGIISAAGTVDFYPNGGIAPQPGCLQINVSGITSLKSDLVVAASCSHSRSTKLFIESINTLQFVATKCSTYIYYETYLCSYNKKTVMGENVPRTESGVFYLLTNSNPPFARG